MCVHKLENVLPFSKVYTILKGVKKDATWKAKDGSGDKWKIAHVDLTLQNAELVKYLS